jgi:zinc protease
MAFEADRMVNLQLTDEEVLPERDVVLEERRMRTDSDPSAQLSESVAATLFANHPYGTPIIGWRHEIEDLWRTDALAYYGRFYTPENAILVVAGDVAADEVRQLADETYGQVPSRGAAPVRMRRREPDPTAHRRVEVIDPKVEQPSFQRHWLVPSYTSGDEKEAFALDVLAQLLGGSNASRLTKILVNAQQLAVSAGCWYMGSAMDRTRLAVYAIPREGVSLTDLETAAQRVVDDLAKGIPDDELERAKTRLVADAIYAQDSQATLARMYGSALATGSTVEDVQRWPAGIESVTAADVIAVARKYLKARFAVTGHLLKDTGSNDGDDTL